ncbi:hypothetical protein [Acuticoccus kandeliae]|uniref:hypothetical protein n=1 Tax=Acuticoccus kandeliae TaxID=2073160 RepID=UPI001300B90D|nr:hypothetical protein [Acuticoccus kandeliae]
MPIIEFIKIILERAIADAIGIEAALLKVPCLVQAHQKTLINLVDLWPAMPLLMEDS